MGDVTFVSGNYTSIHGGTFVEAGRDANFQSGQPNRHGFELLRKHIASGAFHNAIDRVDPPKCHPNTRTVILDEIMTWVQSPPSHRKFIMWLYGPAGAGKSAISQTIAEMCAKVGLLAASFFFFRTASRRNTSSHLIATLAYQLAISIPVLRDGIGQAVENDPTIFERLLTTQMDELIIKPIKNAHAERKLRNPFPNLVIIDGLDECVSESEQADILQVLVSAANRLVQLPLIFFIISRPDYTIRTNFNRKTVIPIVQTMTLDDNYRPDEDIKLFLKETFENLTETHPAGPNLPPDWPSEDQLSFLVKKASGQFIYASTVAKYIASPRHIPSRRLKFILGLSTSANDMPFSQLDALYRHILSAVEDLPKVLDILTSAMIFDNPELYAVFPMWNQTTIEEYETIFAHDHGEVRTALLDMHAVILVPESDDSSSRLRVHHASLEDFLLDRSRSQEYFIDIEKAHTKIAVALLKALTSVPDADTEDQGQQHVIIQYTAYLAIHFVYHFQNASTESMIPCIADTPVHSLCLSQHSFFNTPWISFHRCLESLGLDQYSQTSKERLTQWMFNKLQKYPEPILLPIITGLYCLALDSSSFQDVFTMLLHGMSSSTSDLNRLEELDRDLLSFTDILPSYREGGITFLGTQILQYQIVAGQYIVNDDTCCGLAHQLVDFLLERGTLLKPTSYAEHPTLAPSDEDSISSIYLAYPDLNWFSEIFKRSSKDAKFADLLESKLSFWKESETFLIPEARENMIKFSKEYIARCREDPVSLDSLMEVEDMQ